MNTTQPAGKEVLSLAVDDIFPDLHQPRKSLLKEELDRMVASVAARGILQPIRVRWDDSRSCWVIISGETRWRSAKLAGYERVPCLPVTGDLDETDVLEEQITENVVRNQFRPLELARALARLKALKGATSQQLAADLGISAASVCRAESLLSLPEDIQTLVDSGAIPESTAYELSRLPDEKGMRELAYAAAAGKLSRDQVADSVRASVGKRQSKARAVRIPLKLEGGISVTVSASQPLGWDAFNAALDRIRREAKRLHEGGKDVSELAHSLRTS